MQNQWYGDKRDLVKWGVLLELTRRHRVKHILQVLYARENTWARLEIDGEQVELPSAVLKHFRDSTSVSEMQCLAQIEVFSELFGNRSDYLRRLCCCEFSHEQSVRHCLPRPRHGS
jgi:hypothetical protein